MPALMGSRLGPFEIVAAIGAGGMGEVYRARDSRLGRDVAIKMLPAELAGQPDALARFEREARAVAALNHPNILALHDIGREGSVAYAVMELLEGETLSARLLTGPVPPRRALDYLAQIARGLAAAHERGIVHRDIKPDNLFITSDGRLKILDFGVAVQADRPGTAEVTAVGLTEPGMLIGTPSYMAPEQLLAQAATPRSDLFAFGLVAHEMLTGTHPFKRATAGEVSIAILHQEPAPLGAVAQLLPPGAAPLLARCLEKPPGERPGSARDLALYLESLSNSTDTALQRPVELHAEQVPVVRRRVLKASFALLLLVVLLTWGYAGFMADQVVNTVVETDLVRAERLVLRVQGERLTRLALTSQLLASSPQLKALFGTDPATMRGYLVEQQAAYPGTPILIALLPDRRVLARTDTATAAPPGPGDSWESLLAPGAAAFGVVSIDGRPHHAAASISEAAGTVFGSVVAAVPIDPAFAQSVSEATQDEIVLLGNSVLGTTLRGSQTPWSSLQGWRESGGRDDGVMNVDIGTQRFAAREIPLSDQPRVSVVVAKSRDEIVAPFRQIQSGLLVIGVVCAAVAVAGALWVARRAG